jgi:hypothetical protein
VDSTDRINADYKEGDVPLTIYQHTDIQISRSPVNGEGSSSDNGSVDLGGKGVGYGSRAVIEGQSGGPAKGFQGV